MEQTTNLLEYIEMKEYSEEFKYWYERIYLQSPRMCKLEYDDEKTWEAWKAGQQALGQMLKDNAELGKQK